MHKRCGRRLRPWGHGVGHRGAAGEDLRARTGRHASRPGRGQIHRVWTTRRGQGGPRWTRPVGRLATRSPRCAASPSCSSAPMAPTYKVQAFRRRRRRALDRRPHELADRAAAGTLQPSCPASGRRPRRWSPRRCAGSRPGVPRRRSRRARGPLATGGQELRARLRGDLHSALATGPTAASPIEEMVMAALELGHEYLALTDHSPPADRRQRAEPPSGSSASSSVVAAVNAHVGPAASGCSPASRSTSSTTAASTRPPTCWPARRRRRLGALEAADGRRRR